MKTSIIKSTILITIASIIVKLLSFVQQILLSNRFGASAINDTYITSVSIIALFVSFFASPFSSTYLPYATKYYLNNDKKLKAVFFGSIYIQALIIGILQSILLYFTLDALIPIIAPGFANENQETVRHLVIFQIPSLVIQMLIGVNNSNMQVVGQFSLPQLLSGIPYLFSVAYLFSASRPNTITLAIITSISYAVIFIVQSPILRKHIPIKFSLKTDSLDMKLMYMTMGSFLITSVVRQLNSIVNQAFASLLPEGSITVLSNASKIAITGSTLISVAISTVSYAQMSKNIYSDEGAKNQQLLNDSLKLVNIIIIPISVVFIVFSQTITNILFGHGAFSSDAVYKTGLCLAIYSFSMIGYGIQDVIVRSMFAYRVSRYSVISSAVMAVVNIFLNYLFYRQYGVLGLAASSSLSLLLIIPYLLYKADKAIIKIDLGAFIKSLGLSCLMATISAVVTKIIFSFLLGSFGNMVSLTVSMSSFFLLYLLLGFYFHEEICRQILSSLKIKTISKGRKNGKQ